VKVRRGQIWWIDWSPSRGSEQAGMRPALIVQNDVGNEYSRTTIVAAVTTSIKGDYPFLVRISAGESGLPHDSAVNCAQLLTVDKARLSERCGQLDREKMAAIDEALKVSLSIT
jgi:mRNA interferase MazF